MAPAGGGPGHGAVENPPTRRLRTLLKASDETAPLQLPNNTQPGIKLQTHLWYGTT